MKKTGAVVVVLSLLGVAAACSSTSGDLPTGTAGTSAATAGSFNAQAGSGVSAAGASGAVGAAGTSSGGGIPGAAGASVGGSSGGLGAAGLGGGGLGTGGASGGAAVGGAGMAGTAGAAPIVPYVPAWACLNPTWPTPTGSPVSISSTKSISGSYDGKMALHDGSGSGDFAKDCSGQGTAPQGTTKALFELEDGATLQNVIVGNHGADGIHCKGTCTIKNVWFQNVCDDMVTAASGSSGTVTIDGGGARNAHDKLFQDNSHGKFIVQNFYGEKLGKMYRACGEGGACDSTKGNLTMTNVTAVGVDQVVGLTKGRDKATLSKICLFQSPTVCQTYDSSDNKVQDGPDGTTCVYKWTDTQVMVNKVNSVFETASACPNSLTSGSASNPATACIADLPQCIKSCLPGDNGLKMCDCTGTGAAYKCHACALPVQEPAKSALSPAVASVAPACSGVTAKKACSKEWEVCTSGTQVCACVFKPGYLQTANTVWDCVNPWW